MALPLDPVTPSRSYTPLVLAGGLGTRLADAVPGLPKVLAPVRGRPFLTFLLDGLVRAGFSEAVLCVGFRASDVEQQLGKRYGSLRLIYSRESAPRGTGGALRLALAATPSPWLLILNGDSYCSVNLQDFLRWHARRTEPVGLVLASVPDTRRYGSVDLDASDRISGFREKAQAPAAGRINAGIYSVPRSLLEAIPADQPYSLERDAFPPWLALGMAGFPSAGPFIDIGVPESYRQADAFFENSTPS